MRIKCYKAGKNIEFLTYSDFIKFYKDRNKAQKDWQFAVERVKTDPIHYEDGQYAILRKDAKVFYFCNNLSKKQVSTLSSPKLNKRNANSFKEFKTIYKEKEERFDECLNRYVKESYPVDFILSGNIGKLIDKDKKFYVILDGDEVKINSINLKLFRTNGVKCVSCGKAGNVFLKVRNANEPNYHLELYFKDGYNLERMTRDHILPLSKDGADHLSNLQVMCESCNQKKGQNLNLKDRMNGFSQEELLTSKLTSIEKYCSEHIQDTHCRAILKIIKGNKIEKNKSLFKGIKKILGIR